MKKLHKKVGKELKQGMPPTEFIVIRIDKGKFVIRRKEIDLGDIIDKDEINFIDSTIPKRMSENDPDVFIRISNS
jgi:hypothetical protein